MPGGRSHRVRSAVVLAAALVSGLFVPISAVGQAPDPAAPTGTAVATGSPTATDPSDVRPIDWERLRSAPAVDGPASDRLAAVLANSNRFALTTWWAESGYADQTGPYLDLGALAGPAYESFALAVSLATDAYDPTEVGVPRAEATDATLRLVRSIAIGHRANGPDPWWGGGWQDALWAANAGYAGWLLWDQLDPVDRENVRRMVESEADRLAAAEVPYYRDEDGAIVRVGNSAAEENAWNSMLLQLATAMLPDHPRQRLWMDRNLELMISAFSRPEDVTDRRRLNGKPLSLWLEGSNIESDGLLINHSRVHPDYMTTYDFNLMAGAAYTLAGESTPVAALHNLDRVYAALVDAEFPSPPYQAPGGTIYLDGAAEVYYPQGTDWSPTRRMIFGTADVMARAFGLDGRASTPASTWEGLHVGAALAQQERHPDGRMFAPGEFTSEPNDGAAVPARAYLVDWLTRRDLVEFTNRAYPVPPGQQRPAALTLASPERLYAGATGTVTVTLNNRSTLVMTRVAIRLDVPAGWVATATSPPTAGRLRPDEELTVAWTVTAPADGPADLVDLAAVADYRTAGRAGSGTRSARVWTLPEGRVPPAAITATASDAQSGYPAGHVVDDDLQTIWHSQYRPPAPPPHAVTLDLGGAYDLTSLSYQPRLGSPNGTITSYRVLVSPDGQSFSEVAAGEWVLDESTKTVSLDAPGVRQVRLEAVTGAQGYASAAEIVVVGSPA